jgi:16S rRNA (cytidine1402-2'-O)-methyltransferase
MSDPSSASVGQLVLVATPIGNLGDFSPRAVEVLKAADVICCEDTRHTRKLLSAYSIEGKRLLAVHEHNEHNAAAGIVELAQRGQTIALVTDAGMPAVSDPGERVVAACVAAGIDVVCVPGPSAALTALAISGLPTQRFVFEGFLPVKGPDRASRLAVVGSCGETIILFEGPHRLIRTLSDLSEVCGPDRVMSVSRELTKKFEQTQRGAVGALLVRMQTADAPAPRGEYVIVVGGHPGTDDVLTVVTDADVLRLLQVERDRGARTKEAVDLVTAATGLPRRHVYGLAVARPVSAS